MRRILALTLCLSIATPAIAADFLGEASAGFAATGFSGDLQKAGGKHKAVMTIDQPKVIAAVPALQRMGVINPDITQTYVNAAPFSLTTTTAAYFTVAAIPELYRTHPEVDQLDVSVIATYPDEYGNDKRNDLFSFSFTRAIFTKVNWEKFQPMNLAKVAPGFKYSPWCLGKVAREQG